MSRIGFVAFYNKSKQQTKKHRDMNELEEYRKKVDEALEKEKEAFDKLNDVRNENRDYVEEVLLPNNGHLSPEQKQKEQELVEKLREARKELNDAIEELEKL